MSNTQLDPTKYEVLYNRLEQALIEAKEVIKQLSASVIVRDEGEVCQGFLLPNGDSVLLATGLLNHLFTIARCVKFMNENNLVNTVTAATLKYYGEYPANSKRYWAFPTEGDALGFAYRKDLFTDAKEKAAFKAK